MIQAGDRIRFSLEVVDSTGVAVWSEEVQAERAGILDAQLAVAHRLAAKLTASRPKPD
jgi:TolB-like protein